MGRTRNNAKHLPEIQCKYCIKVLQGETRYARHVLSKHREHIKDYIQGV